jgi:predicted permease
MIDSTMINYGLSKFSKVVNNATPFLKNVSEQYVHFTVVKTIALVPVAIVALIISSILFSYSLKWLKKSDGDDAGTIACTTLSGCAVLVAFIASCVCIYDCCLALCCPEMFTIQQIINTNK